MATAYNSSGILGQYEAAQASALSGATDKVATDKDTFLKLLVAQLTHQDPLNPVEDKEFIAQLAQFTSVEELQKISSGIDGLNEKYTKQNINTAAGLMGRRVVAKGDNVTLLEGYQASSYIYAEFPRDAASVVMNVYATDGDGNPTSMVYSQSLGAQGAGTIRHYWDGYASNGSRCANGSYVVTFSAVDAEGKSMLVDTSSDGIVVGVQTSEDGNHILYLEDNRQVRFNDIDLVAYAPEAGGNGDGTDPTDPENPGDGETDDDDDDDDSDDDTEPTDPEEPGDGETDDAADDGAGGDGETTAP